MWVKETLVASVLEFNLNHYLKVAMFWQIKQFVLVCLFISYLCYFCTWKCLTLRYKIIMEAVLLKSLFASCSRQSGKHCYFLINFPNKNRCSLYNQHLPQNMNCLHYRFTYDLVINENAIFRPGFNIRKSTKN